MPIKIILLYAKELKVAPFGDIWNEYCRRCGAPLDGELYKEVAAYENEVLAKRQ